MAVLLAELVPLLEHGGDVSARSKIEWCDHTFNPWWGCAKVSPGCNHCYAEGVSARWGHDVWGVNADRRFFGDKHWAEPLKWNRQAEASGVHARVFSGSMCDVFEDREDLFQPRARLFDLIEATPWLDWLLLTKRPQNVSNLAAWGGPGLRDWPANVWLGTSVEDQRRADERIPRLLEVPARVRFLSAEPLLGPVDLSTYFAVEWMDSLGAPGTDENGGYGHEMFATLSGRVGPAGGLHWVIVGGESGPGARPMHPQWARDIRDQCAAADVPFFFKQWGDWIPVASDRRDGDALVIPNPWNKYNRRDEHGRPEHYVPWNPNRDGLGPGPDAMFGSAVLRRVGKKAAGRELDGRTWDNYPTPAVAL